MMPSSSRQSFSLLLPRTWFPVRSCLNLSPGLAVPGWPTCWRGGVSAGMGTIYSGLTLIMTEALAIPASCGGYQIPHLELALRFDIFLFPSMRLQNFSCGLHLLLLHLQMHSLQILGSPPVSPCLKLGIETHSLVHSLLPFRGVFICIFR